MFPFLQFFYLVYSNVNLILRNQLIGSRETQQLRQLMGTFKIGEVSKKLKEIQLIGLFNTFKFRLAVFWS